MNTYELMLRLHGKNIYENFDPAPFPDDIQGWNSNHPLLSEVVRVRRPGFVVEVGVWKGASAIFIAEQMRNTGIAGTILCVDTFLGSITHLTNPAYAPALASPHGWPNLYYLFMANVVRRQLESYICPFAQTSDTAFEALHKLGLHPDMVHIDAAHDHDSVARELENYYSLLAPGGVLVGDDFSLNWPEVVWAATEFAKRKGLALQHAEGKFLLQKPSAIV